MLLLRRIDDGFKKSLPNQCGITSIIRGMYDNYDRRNNSATRGREGMCEVVLQEYGWDVWT